MNVEKSIGTLMLMCLTIGFLTYGVMVRFLPLPESSVLWPLAVLALIVPATILNIRHIQSALKVSSKS